MFLRWRWLNHFLMKRAIWRGDGRIDIDEAPNPQDGRPLGPKEVLLRVKAIGVCGTDIHILDERFPQVRPPRVLGHEIAGVVERVGNEVRRVHPGSRVTCDSVVGCGECRFCLAGKRQFCPTGYELGFTRDGGCQEWLIVPEENVYTVSDSVSMDEAAILDMEVYAALKKPGIRPGDVVLIEGPGPAGLVASQVARILGARRILLSGDSEFRLQAGKSLGADRTIDIRKEDVAEAVREETEGQGADLVMDCAGTAESFRQALDAVAAGGKVVLYGVYPDPLPQVSILPVILKDLVVYGSLSDRRYWDDVIELVEHGRLNLKRLITHTLPVEEAAKAYGIVRHQKDGVVKVVLHV